MNAPVKTQKFIINHTGRVALTFEYKTDLCDPLWRHLESERRLIPFNPWGFQYEFSYYRFHSNLS